MAQQFDSVEAYFAGQPEKTRQKLFELRDCILEVVPGATALINYNIPAFAMTEGGKRDKQIMIAGFKNHVGLYPHPVTMEKFDAQLTAYKKGKGSVQFPLKDPLPKELIKNMVRFRYEQILSE